MLVLILLKEAQQLGEERPIRQSTILILVIRTQGPSIFFARRHRQPTFAPSEARDTKHDAGGCSVEGVVRRLFRDPESVSTQDQRAAAFSDF